MAPIINKQSHFNYCRDCSYKSSLVGELVSEDLRSPLDESHKGLNQLD